MSTPRVFLNVIDAMYPRRESSAATKYSPAMPHSVPDSFGAFVSAVMGGEF